MLYDIISLFVVESIHDIMTTPISQKQVPDPGNARNILPHLTLAGVSVLSPWYFKFMSSRLFTHFQGHITSLLNANLTFRNMTSRILSLALGLLLERVGYAPYVFSESDSHRFCTDYYDIGGCGTAAENLSK